jgi:septum site-determining protein MinC
MQPGPTMEARSASELDPATATAAAPAQGYVPARRPAFELKGVMASLTVLRLQTTDVDIIERQLRATVAQRPQFFQDAPVVLDFGAVEGAAPGFPFRALSSALRACRMIPVAVANLDERCRPEAFAAGLGVLRAGQTRARQAAGSADPRVAAAAAAARAAADRSSAAAEEQITPPPVAARARAQQQAAQQQASQAATPTPVASVHRGAMVVRQPVRGGQVIYAQGGDLIVTAPVNPGAQVIADGHVHIYAPLRGRAMAGAQGMVDARIYCQRIEAELVAVAGAYAMADDIPASSRGKPAQVLLENGECRIIPLV